LSFSWLREIFERGGKCRLFRRSISIPHVEHELPASVFLLLPDAGVFAVFDNGLSVSTSSLRSVSTLGLATVEGEERAPANTARPTITKIARDIRLVFRGSLRKAAGF
jgi:hypothetical protein